MYVDCLSILNFFYKIFFKLYVAVFSMMNKETPLIALISDKLS